MKLNVMEDLGEPRKNQFLNWSRGHEQNIQRAAVDAKSSVVFGGNGYSVCVAPSHTITTHDFPLRERDAFVLGDEVLLKADWPAHFLAAYDPLRSKTKSHGRTRFEYLYHQILERLESCDSWALDIGVGSNAYGLEEEVERPKKYVPSDALVNIVRKSILRRKGELESMFKDNKIVLDEDSSALDFIYEPKAASESTEAIRTFISNSIRGFLATISQGLAYGDGESAVLSKDGELLDVVLVGFRHRIPVMLKDAGIFSAQLYRDLEKAAHNGLLSNEFGKLEVKDGEILVTRLKTLVPASERPEKRKRATIARIG